MKGIFNLLRARLLNAKFPHAIQFNVTFRCNHRCVYCAVYNDLRTEMTTQQICAMIDVFAAMGTTRLSITGGEPLLREDLGAIVHHAKQRGLFISVATNGSLVPQCLEALSEVDSVNMTLDGPPEIHDKQRGQGNFQEVLQAAALLKQKNIAVHLNFILTKDNCDLLTEMAGLSKSLRVKLLIQPVFYAEASHANNQEGYLKTRCEDPLLIQALDKVLRLKQENPTDLMLSSRYYKDIQNAVRTGKKIICRTAGSLFCTISPDGKVAPCNLLVRDGRWLNGNEVGFEKAFLAMPPQRCDGCLSSFIDFDNLYQLKPDVVWNYYRHYLDLSSGQEIRPVLLLQWLCSLARKENIFAIIGSLMRRAFHLPYLKMGVDIKTLEVKPLPWDGFFVTGYSPELEAGCLKLLSSVGSLGSWSRQRFANDILDTVQDPGRDIYIVQDEQGPVAMTVLHTMQLYGGRPEIGFVAVAPACRGKKLGYKLFMHIYADLKQRDITRLFLRTDAFRLAAIKLYLDAGWKPEIEGAAQRRRWGKALAHIAAKASPMPRP